MSFTIGSWADLCFIIVIIIPHLHLGASKTSRLDFCAWHCWMWHCVLSMRCSENKTPPPQRLLKGWYGWCDELVTLGSQQKVQVQGGLVCCSPWGRQELDTTWLLNNSSKMHYNSLRGVMVGKLGRAWTLNGDLLANSINHCFCRWAGEF